jgi:hypothetical protein
LGNSYPVAVMPAHRRRRPGSRSRSRVAHVARELCGRRLLKGQATTTGFAKGIFARPVTNVSARSRGQRDEYLTPRHPPLKENGKPTPRAARRGRPSSRTANRVNECTVAVIPKSTGENVTLEYRSRSIASVGARRSSALWRLFCSDPCVYLAKLKSAHCSETALALVVRTACHRARRKRSRQPTRS